MPSTPPPAPPARRRLALAVSERDDVLLRVLTLLHARRCHVTRLEFVADDRHRPGRFSVEFDAPVAQADRVPLWLERLVDVVAVEAG